MLGCEIVLLSTFLRAVAVADETLHSSMSVPYDEWMRQIIRDGVNGRTLLSGDTRTPFELRYSNIIMTAVLDREFR